MLDSGTSLFPKSCLLHKTEDDSVESVWTVYKGFNG